MKPVRALALITVAMLLGGCVYYNAMYNTKRLAGSARKAERDGRTLAANNLWGQVVTRAESLVARHPDSKYVDEALVLKGLALSRLRQCQSAVAPLNRVSLLPRDAEVVEDATLALGRCQLELGHPALAASTIAPVAESDDPVRRGEARLILSRALRVTGRADEAVAAIEGVPGARAASERLLALAAAHRREEADALLDTLLAVRDSTARWDTVAASVGAADPIVASSLVDRLERRPGTPPALRAQLLYEDGLRLGSHDTARSDTRLRQAAALDSAGDYAGRARLRLTRNRLARSASVADLRPMTGELQELVGARGNLSAEAGQLSALITRVIAAIDSAASGAPRADLRLFLAAETARDSLAARALAASMFRTIVETMPDSPYAPKAILAGRALDPAWGESVVALLEERYPLSPYVALLRGEEPHGYAELEDSLRSFATGSAVRSTPQPQRPHLREDSIAARRRAPPPRRGLEP
ncbi:MAG TPA: hypothetical protein VHG35_10305 [Gemmatimonadales bacterium]|nr:hypothetical protein [Gemmatimonadales bacterium]